MKTDLTIPYHPFVVHEADGFDPSLALNVLYGQLACAVFRKFCTVDESAVLQKSFRQCGAVRRREGAAAGTYLGSFHWGQQLEEYFQDAEFIVPALNAVIDSDPKKSWLRFVRLLEDALAAENGILRSARWHDRIAAWPIIRSWDAGGTYSLVPHEDAAQCVDPQQIGFEIQDIAPNPICSVNLCIANDGAGELLLWNYRPSEDDRRQFGTQNTGGPYPADALTKFQRADVSVRTGDLYIFDGTLVHAVAATVGYRATVSSLLGFCDTRTVVMWT